MALRTPARTRAATSTTGSGTYTLTEPGAAGWRTFTQAVTAGDLAHGDQVLYCVVDTTANPGVMEIGLGTWNNTTKTLTRDTVYQPNGSAVSWGAGTRDVFVVDPVQLAVLTLAVNQTIAGQKTFSAKLTALLGGTAFSVDGLTPLLVQNSGSSTSDCRLAIIGGTAGSSEVSLGDTAGQYRGRLLYNHVTDRLDVYTAGSLVARFPSSGAIEDASGRKYDAFPAGTRLVLANNSVPPGWSLVSSLADKVLLTTSTVGEIDDQGGSWTISGVTIGGTTLTISQIPAHDHQIKYDPVLITTGGAFNLKQSFASGGSTEAAITPTGSGSSHTHSFSQDGSWRPSYYKTGIIQKS